jgi:hypothetical protein
MADFDFHSLPFSSCTYICTCSTYYPGGKKVSEEEGGLRERGCNENAYKEKWQVFPFLCM